jgi:fructoselysine-6-P-deglycase FrlB-like protein
MAKMNKNFEDLEYRINEANNSGAYSKIKDMIEGVNGNAIVVGTGGSYAVADYISRSLKCFAASIKPREIFFQNLDFIDYVVLTTYSGRTPDIIQCIEQCRKYKNIKKVTVITRDGQTLREKVKLDDNVDIIGYKNNDTKEKSFISIASTLAPASLIARYFAESKGIKFDSCLKRLLEGAESEAKENIKCIDFNVLKANPFVEVIYEWESKSAAAMLESNFTETGMAYSSFHEKKDFSHGRYMLNYKKGTPILIWLKNSPESQYDKELTKYLSHAWKGRQVLILNSADKGRLGEFEIMVKGMCLTNAIAGELGVDLSETDYDKDADSLYSFIED